MEFTGQARCFRQISGRAAGLILLAVVFSFFAYSCRPEKRAPEIDIPNAFSGSGEVPVVDRWWEAFDSPELNRLIETALLESRDVKMAWDRLDQSYALFKMAEAPLYPDLTATLGVSDLEYEGSDVGAAMEAQEGTMYSGALTLNYELDLWGRVRSSRKASLSVYDASREDLQSMGLMISGQVASAWLSIIGEKAQIAVLEKQISTNQDYLELLELRFSNGMAQASDVLSQRQQLAAVKSEVPMSRMRLAALEHGLATLLGKPPKHYLGIDSLEMPDMPPAPDTGVTSDLLLRRPDVNAARTRLAAADYRVDEAIANQFPRISLSVSASDQDEEFHSLFDNWARNLAANLAMPLFQGGRLRLDVKRNEAAAREAFHNFEKTILTALREVEDALIKEKMQREYIEGLEDQIKAARLSLDFSRARFMNGDATYLQTLITLQSLQRLERGEIEARRQLMVYRIDLYRALAGGFEMDREKDVEDGQE